MEHFGSCVTRGLYRPASLGSLMEVFAVSVICATRGLYRPASLGSLMEVFAVSVIYIPIWHIADL